MTVSIPADVEGWEYTAELVLVLGDVLLLPLLVLVMEEEKEEGLMALVAGMVVDDSSTAVAVAVAVVEGRGCSGMDDSDRRWSSGMGAKWVWSELVM